jgi:hypothetical protein
MPAPFGLPQCVGIRRWSMDRMNGVQHAIASLTILGLLVRRSREGSAPHHGRSPANSAVAGRSPTSRRMQKSPTRVAWGQLAVPIRAGSKCGRTSAPRLPKALRQTAARCRKALCHRPTDRPTSQASGCSDSRRNRAGCRSSRKRASHSLSEHWTDRFPR